MANDVFHFTCFKLGHVSLAVVVFVYMKYFSLPSFDTFHTKCYLKVITRALFIKNMEHVSETGELVFPGNVVHIDTSIPFESLEQVIINLMS